MSTRCHIAFYEKKPRVPINQWKVLLYRHSDGYPEGVLPDIIPFLQDFNRVRGLDDYEYCAARLLQHLTNKTDLELREYSLKMNFKNVSEPRYLGYGISSVIHSDIDYFYAIYPTEVRVYEVTGSWEDHKLKLIQTIAI